MKHVSKVVATTRTKNAYLNQFQRPGLHIPFTLRYVADIVVDEETLGLDLQDQTIGYLANTGHQLRHWLRKEIIEKIHSFDNNLVRIGCGVRPSLRRRWGCP